LPCDELLRNAKSDHDFVTKVEHKPDREGWVLDQWLTGHARRPSEIRRGADPPDFVVDGTGIEVVEAMQAGRRRGDDYKEKVEAAKAGYAFVRRLPSLHEVRKHGHLWILNQVEQKTAKRYAASKRWILVVYANFSWTEQVQWELLEAKLIELHPPFASVEVVFSTPAGSVARTVFPARKV
jgi:hypothetical protein